MRRKAPFVTQSRRPERRARVRLVGHTLADVVAAYPYLTESDAEAAALSRCLAYGRLEFPFAAAQQHVLGGAMVTVEPSRMPVRVLQR